MSICQIVPSRNLFPRSSSLPLAREGVKGHIGIALGDVKLRLDVLEADLVLFPLGRLLEFLSNVLKLRWIVMSCNEDHFATFEVHELRRVHWDELVLAVDFLDVLWGKLLVFDHGRLIFGVFDLQDKVSLIMNVEMRLERVRLRRMSQHLHSHSSGQTASS